MTVNARVVRDAQGVLREPSFYTGIQGPLATLAQQLSDGKGFIQFPDFSKGKNKQIWQLMMRDAHFWRAIQQRLHDVAGSEWYLEPANAESKVMVQYFEALLKMTPNFTDLRHNLGVGVFEGRSFVKQSVGEREVKIGSDVMRRKWRYVGGHHHIPADAIQLQWDDEPVVDETGPWTRRRYYWAIWDMERRQHLRVSPEQSKWYLKFFYHRDGYTLGGGRPLLDSLFFAWYHKTHLVQYLLQGIERFGVPWIMAQIEGLRGMGNTQGANFKALSDHAATLAAEIEKQRAGNVLVLDTTDKVQLLDMSGEAGRAILAILQYFDDAFIGAVTGALQPSGQRGTTGTYASASIEKDQQSSVFRYDRDTLQEALQPMIWRLFEWNLDNFSQIRAPNGRWLSTLEPPIFKLRDAPISFANMLELVDRGVPVLRKELMQAAGATVPDADDDVFIAPQFKTPAVDPATGQPAQPMVPMDAPASDPDGLMMREGRLRRALFSGAGSYLDSIHAVTEGAAA